MRKVGIVGIGHVGVTVAHIIVSQGLADELVLIDHNTAKLASEELDLRDSASLLDKHIFIHAGNYNDLADAEVVISALGHIDLITEGGDRFEELRANAPEARQVGADLQHVGFHGVLLVISNPVDVITGIYQKATGLPHNQVIGTGTYLDTARLKRSLADILHLDPRSINGYVLGEHGDSQFAAWSTVNVLGENIDTLTQHYNLNLTQIEQAARVGGFTVFSGKGYTNFAIAHAAVSLLELILSDAHRESIVSHFNIELGSYISSPAVIGREGIVAEFNLPLHDDEKEKLLASAKAIQQKTQHLI